MQLSHLSELVVLAILVAPSAAIGQAIPVQLLFNGVPLLVTAAPEFACLDRTRNTWIGCRIERETDGTRYFLSRPVAGEYTLHVKIDENRRTRRASQVTTCSNIDLPRLMRVKAPWDNDRDLNGMLARPWAEKPGFTISRSGVATVTFEWDAVVPGAEYTYSIVTARNDPYLEGPESLRGTTTRTKLTVQLPPSPPDHYFRFGISARKGDRLVGDFMTHDSVCRACEKIGHEDTKTIATKNTRPRSLRILRDRRELRGQSLRGPSSRNDFFTVVMTCGHPRRCDLVTSGPASLRRERAG